MTLREAIIAVARTEIPHPEILAHHPITNIDELCPIGVANYLLSMKFREDMDAVQLDVQDAYDHGASDFDLFLDGTTGEYTLTAKYTYPEDSIDCDCQQ